jgi:hypothetical protein
MAGGECVKLRFPQNRQRCDSLASPGILSATTKSEEVMSVRYKDFIGGCMLVCLLGNGDRLIYWGSMAALSAVALLLIASAVTQLR